MDELNLLEFFHFFFSPYFFFFFYEKFLISKNFTVRRIEMKISVSEILRARVSRIFFNESFSRVSRLFVNVKETLLSRSVERNS